MTPTIATVTFKLSKEKKEQLKKLAHENYQTVSEYLRTKAGLI